MLKELKFCQFCGASLEADMKVCAGCGQSVGGTGSAVEYLQDQPEPSQPPPSAPPPPQQSAPPPVIEPPRTAPPPPPPAGRKKLPTWAIIVIILVVLCCCAAATVGAFFLWQSLNESESSTSPAASTQSTALALLFTNTPELPTESPTQTLTSIPTPTFEPTPTLEPTPTFTLPPTFTPPPPPSQSLTEDTLIDDFSSNQFGWTVEMDQQSSFGFQDNRYFIQVYEDGWRMWESIPTDFTPTYLSFTAQIEAGNAGLGYYGMVCNVQNNENYHYIEIDPALRRYRIGFMTSEEEYYLTPYEWNYSFYLSGDPYAVNQIGVRCTNDTIRLEINGELETEVSFAPAEPGGWVGLLASTWDAESLPTGGFTVYFDDLYATTRE